MFKGVELTIPFPEIDNNTLQKIEDSLESRFGYANLPEDYKSFLLKSNGYVFRSDIDNDEYFGFQIEYPYAAFADVYSVFGAWHSSFGKPQGSQLEYPELFSSNENSKFDFDVLPDGMMSIACQMNGGCLFAMSVSKTDFGKIYFFDDGYYESAARNQQPEWDEEKYRSDRTENILSKYPEYRKDIENLWANMRDMSSEEVQKIESTLPESCRFELDSRHMIPVAASFNEFIQKLEVKKLG